MFRIALILHTNMSSNKKLIAIAGGTSPTLGTAIVNALVESTICSPVIFSRIEKGEKQPQSRSIPAGVEVSIRYVDYDDENDIKKALEGVHTVISVILIIGPEW